MHWIDWLWVFLACSFLGWLMESVRFSIEERHWVNRGFLTGPLCPIYGFGSVLILALFGLFDHSWLLVLIIGIVLTTLLEYLTSWIMEFIFHARWWDYSTLPFNLHGRITLFHSLFWGALCLALVYGLNPLLTGILAAIPLTFRIWAGAIVAVMILVDLAFTVAGMLDLNRQLSKLQDKIQLIRLKNTELGENMKKRLAMLSQHFRELRQQAGTLNNVQRRLLRAFPNLRSLDYQDALRRLRRWMKMHAPHQTWPMADIRMLRNQLPALRGKRDNKQKK